MSANISQIWAMLTGYGNLVGGFKPVRNGVIIYFA